MIQYHNANNTAISIFGDTILDSYSFNKNLLEIEYSDIKLLEGCFIFNREFYKSEKQNNTNLKSNNKIYRHNNFNHK